MRQNHHLKIMLCHFNQLITGEKLFEIRRNDRDFKNGDWVLLTEIEVLYGQDIETGRRAMYRIAGMSAFEQKPGYVVWSVHHLRMLMLGESFPDEVPE